MWGGERNLSAAGLGGHREGRKTQKRPYMHKDKFSSKKQATSFCRDLLIPTNVHQNENRERERGQFCSGRERLFPDCDRSKFYDNIRHFSEGCPNYLHKNGNIDERKNLYFGRMEGNCRDMGSSIFGTVEDDRRSDQESRDSGTWSQDYTDNNRGIFYNEWDHHDERNRYDHHNYSHRRRQRGQGPISHRDRGYKSLKRCHRGNGHSPSQMSLKEKISEFGIFLKKTTPKANDIQTIENGLACSRLGLKSEYHVQECKTFIGKPYFTGVLKLSGIFMGRSFGNNKKETKHSTYVTAVNNLMTKNVDEIFELQDPGIAAKRDEEVTNAKLEKTRHTHLHVGVSDSVQAGDNCTQIINTPACEEKPQINMYQIGNGGSQQVTVKFSLNEERRSSDSVRGPDGDIYIRIQVRKQDDETETPAEDLENIALEDLRTEEGYQLIIKPIERVLAAEIVSTSKGSIIIRLRPKNKNSISKLKAAIKNEQLLRILARIIKLKNVRSANSGSNLILSITVCVPKEDINGKNTLTKNGSILIRLRPQLQDSNSRLKTAVQTGDLPGILARFAELEQVRLASHGSDLVLDVTASLYEEKESLSASYINSYKGQGEKENPFSGSEDQNHRQLPDTLSKEKKNHSGSKDQSQGQLLENNSCCTTLNKFSEGLIGISSTPHRFYDAEYKNWLECCVRLFCFKESLHNHLETQPSTQLLSTLIDVKCDLLCLDAYRLSDFEKAIWTEKISNLISSLNMNCDTQSEMQLVVDKYDDRSLYKQEVSILQGLVSALKSDLDTVKTNMDTYEDVQIQLFRRLETVRAEVTSVHSSQPDMGKKLEDIKKMMEEVVGIDTDIRMIKTVMHKVIRISGKVKSFLDNNPDIVDIDILACIRAIELAVQELPQKQSKLDTAVQKLRVSVGKEISSIEADIRGIKDIIHLRDELLSHYQSVRTIPIPTMDEEENVCLEVFHTADIVLKYVNKKTNISDERKREVEGKKCLHRGCGSVKQSKAAEEFLTSYKQLFLSSQCERIIVTGPLGSGKSTFLRKLLHTWCKVQQERKVNASIAEKFIHDSADFIADEDVLLKFDLLFNISSPAILTETRLIEVLCNQCLQRKEETTSHTLLKLLNDQPEKFIIIFDGLDEMEHIPAFLYDLFRRRLYPRVTVLMGTRSWRVSGLDLKPCSHFDLLLDIRGFSKDNAIKFVETAIDLNRKKCLQAKQCYLSEKEKNLLSSFQNVPLLLLFLAHAWCRNQSLPDKSSDLYSHILDFLVKRCLMKLGNKYTSTMSDHENMDLRLKSFQESFVQLACKAAFHFLQLEKSSPSVLIPRKEFLKELEPNAQIKLGILLDCGIISKANFCPLELNVYITFHHLSIQEYLASAHLVKNKDIFQNFLTSLTTLNDVLRYKNILTFICGLDAGCGQKAFDRICQVCDMDPLVLNYRHGVDRYKQMPGLKQIQLSVENLNEMYKACLREMENQEVLDIHDIVLQGRWDNMMFSRFRKKTVASLCLSKTKLLDPFIDVSSLTDLTALTLDFVVMSDELSRYICRSISGFTHLEKLEMKGTMLHNGVLDLSSLTNLISFSLVWVTMSEECSKSLCSSISCCSYLEKLELQYINLHDGVLDLRGLNCLKFLKLKHVSMSRHCSRSLCNSISGCIYLEELELMYMTLFDGIIELSRNDYLASLTINHVTMSQECIRSVCGIVSACTLLRLEHITLHGGILALSSPVDLMLRSVTISAECSRSLCRSVLDCTHLKNMELRKITLHDGVLDLGRLAHLTSLTLSFVIMSEECSNSFCSSISECTVLQNLELSSIILHNGILDLSSLTRLTFLTLWDVTMSQECSKSLCSSISACTHLEHLRLIDIILSKGRLDLSHLNYLKLLRIHSVTMSRKSYQVLKESLHDKVNYMIFYTDNDLYQVTVFYSDNRLLLCTCESQNSGSELFYSNLDCIDSVSDLDG